MRVSDASSNVAFQRLNQPEEVQTKPLRLDKTVGDGAQATQQDTAQTKPLRLDQPVGGGAQSTTLRDMVQTKPLRLEKPVGGGEQAAATLHDVARTPIRPPLPPYFCSSETVMDAVDDIRNRLESNIFNPVTVRDLLAVQNTIAGLSNEDASAVVAELSDAELRDWANQVTDANLFAPGFSEEQRKAFFETMAQKLDGEQLARLTNAFEQGTVGSTETVSELADAIAQHASDEVKLDYVAALKQGNKLTDQTSVPAHAGTTHVGTTQDFDPQAQAAAQVIASMQDPAMAEKALGMLSSQELDAVITASASPTSYTHEYSSYTSTHYDATTFQQLMQTAAKTGNADLKARVFNSAAQVLKGAESGNSSHYVSADTAAMRQGMHEILMSDVNGVMNELANNQETRNGTAMAIYAKSALNAGEYDQLGNIQARLALGNDLSGNHVDRFNSPEQDFMHAQNAGYFAGAVDAAVGSITSDANKQAEIVNAVISSAATVVGAALPSAGGVALGVGATASGFIVKAAYEQIASNKEDAASKLRDAALPYASENERPNGEPDLEEAASTEAFSAFEDTWNWTKNNAKP